jgi:hypothetical protein
MHVMTHNEEFEQLREILLPILADAAVGRFEQSVPVPVDGSHYINELLVGIQILLDVIREQQVELADRERQIADMQGQTTEILARILDRTSPR